MMYVVSLVPVSSFREKHGTQQLHELHYLHTPLRIYLSWNIKCDMARQSQNISNVKQTNKAVGRDCHWKLKTYLTFKSIY